MSLRYLDIEIQNVRLTERRKFDRSVTFIGRAKLNALDAQQIDLAAERIGCTRNEFILSAATSLAQAYNNQRDRT